MAWIASPQVSPATRDVLTMRLREVAAPGPTCLTADDRDLLGALMSRLLPGDSAVDGRHAAAAVDRSLASGTTDGWRYDALPPDPEAWRLGLAALRHLLGSSRFGDLDGQRQDALIDRLSRHEADGFDGARWFEDVLVAISEAHVAHPVNQLKMGCTAFADLPLDEPPAIAPAPAGSIRTFAEHEVVDAVIVGSGAGGGPLAWRLARAGQSVVVLEAGRHWNPARDFATDEVAQAEALLVRRTPVGRRRPRSGSATTTRASASVDRRCTSRRTRRGRSPTTSRWPPPSASAATGPSRTRRWSRTSTSSKASSASVVPRRIAGVRRGAPAIRCRRST